MKSLFDVVLVRFVATMFFGACGKDEPVTEGDCLTRGAYGGSVNNGSTTFMLDTMWQLDTTVEF